MIKTFNKKILLLNNFFGYIVLIITLNYTIKKQNYFLIKETLTKKVIV